jgi:hypothetical protein
MVYLSYRKSGLLKRESKKMNIHAEPTILARAIGNGHAAVKSVTYEFPGFWSIRTKKDVYCLGDSGYNFITWNNEAGDKSHATTETNPEFIALAFAAWLDKVEAN